MRTRAYRPTLRLGPIARLSLGLTALLISLLLIGDIMLDVAPNLGKAERGSRERVAATVAVQITTLLETGDEALVGKTIQRLLLRDPDIRAINVYRNNGSATLQRGVASPSDRTETGQTSTADHIRLSILAGQRPWGEIELRFASSEQGTLKAWLTQPAMQLLVVLGIGGFLLSYAYLRRALQFLDPAAAVPDRVRKAFDSLTEGVVILDQQARIVLANSAFRQLDPQAGERLNGQRIDALEWLSEGRGENPETLTPWSQAIENAGVVKDQSINLRQPSGQTIRLLVSSVPITNDKGKVRGCLVTFDDVSAVHRANDELRNTLGELQSSREYIEEQNRELRELATRDSLTGCLNRRAFFDMAEDIFDAARHSAAPICSLMVDIDHFKQFNDLYGHAVGDQVLRAVVRVLSKGLRQNDILCRYGGEEFCVLMPDTTVDQAHEVADRIRIEIGANSHRSIRGTDVMPITASLGLSSGDMGARSLEKLIDQADQALYQAKAAGRNRVVLHERAMA